MGFAKSESDRFSLVPQTSSLFSGCALAKRARPGAPSAHHAPRFRPSAHNAGHTPHSAPPPPCAPRAALPDSDRVDAAPHAPSGRRPLHQPTTLDTATPTTASQLLDDGRDATPGVPAVGNR